MGFKRKAEVSLAKESNKKEKRSQLKGLLDFYDREKIKDDGNCLFRALLFCLYGDDTKHYQLRQEICTYMEKNFDIFRNLADINPSVGVNDWDNYIMYKRTDKIWGDACELFAASEMLNFNYIVYKSCSLDVLEQRFKHPTLPMIYLEFYNGNHYNSLKPKVELSSFPNSKREAKIAIDLKRVKLEKKTLEEEEKKNQVESSIQQEKKLEIKAEKSQESIFSTKQTQELYPQAKKQSDAYNEVYQYLRYGIRPKRIEKNTSFRNWIKDIARRYELKNKSSNKNTQSRLVLRSNGKKKRVPQTIPYKSEILLIIEQAHNGFSHTKVKHNGINMTIRNISELSLYWANMKNDVAEYVNNCIECVETQPIKQIKISKTILADGPLDHMTADCWEIPKEMREASGNKFEHVLTCVDHFSKYKWAELLPNKLAETMVSKIEGIFNHYSNPKIFQTDNGSEFVNREVQNLCESRKIEFKHGRPYHPQSQGVVEKINDFLAKSLRASYSNFMKEKKKKV